MGTRVGPLVLAILLVGFAHWSSPAAAQEGQGGSAYPPYHGPKKTLAVAKFDAHGAFVAKYGSWDVGGGLAAQLISELNKTNRFIVVDRSDLKAVLREQEMALEKLTKGHAPQAGRLLGAQLLIRGSVTEFDQAESGGGLSFGVQVPGFGGGIAPRSQKGTVGMDLRLIDTTSGRIVKTITARQEVSESAIALEATVRNFSFGGDQFNKTPLGKASRATIQDAVRQIVASMKELPWQGLVAKVRGDTVYVNAGQNANLRAGEVLHIYRVVEAVTDPATGQVLGVEERKVGEIRIGKVAERYSTAVLTGGGAKVGDVVRFTSR